MALDAFGTRCARVDGDNGKIEFVIGGIERCESSPQHEFLLEGHLERIERSVRDADQRDRIGEPAEQSIQIWLGNPHRPSADSRGHPRSA